MSIKLLNEYCNGNGYAATASVPLGEAWVRRQGALDGVRVEWSHTVIYQIAGTNPEKTIKKLRKYF